MDEILLWIKDHNILLILVGVVIPVIPILLYLLLFAIGVGYKINNWRWSKHLSALRIKNECVTVDLGIQSKQSAQNEPKLREEIKKLHLDVQLYDTTIKELRELLEAQRDNIGSRDRRIRSLEGTLANGKDAYQALLLTYEDNLKKTNLLQETLSASQSRIETYSIDLEAALPLAAETSRLQTHVLKLDSELSRIRLDNEALQIAGSMLERQLSARDQEVKMVSASLSDTNSKRDLLMERIKGLEAELQLHRSMRETNAVGSLNES
jgi:chromosome segregation ATPase